MGCDIHFFVEYIVNDVWTLAPNQLEACSNCDGTGLDLYEKYCGNCRRGEKEHVEGTRKCLFGPDTLNLVPSPCETSHVERDTYTVLAEHYYSDRWYALFGWLSEVRGSKCAHTIVDRGIPKDACVEITNGIDNVDGHSHGHYTLKELQQFEWDALAGFNNTDMPTLGRDRGFKTTLQDMAKLHPDPACVRAVFCYDN